MNNTTSNGPFRAFVAAGARHTPRSQSMRILREPSENRGRVSLVCVTQRGHRDSASDQRDRSHPMKSIDRAILAARALLAGSSLSQAADLRLPVYKSAQPYSVAYNNWSGFYVGANAGYGFWQTRNDRSSLRSDRQLSRPMARSLCHGRLQLSNGQRRAGSRRRLRLEHHQGHKCSVVCTDCETKTLGWRHSEAGSAIAFDRWLPYFTGTGIRAIKAVTPAGSETTTKAGYRTALWRWRRIRVPVHWSAKIEYLYVHLADGNCNVPCGSPVPPIDVKFNTSLIRAGLNYKFSGPVFEMLNFQMPG